MIEREDTAAIATLTYLGMVMATREYGNMQRDKFLPHQVKLFEQVDKYLERVLEHFEKRCPMAGQDTYDSITENFLDCATRIEEAIIDLIKNT